MSTRFRLVSTAAVCVALALVAARIRAADNSDAAAPLWSGLVPDDAFNAIVVYPRRALMSPAVAKFGIERFLRHPERKIGFPLSDLDEAVFMVGRMVPLPNSRGSFPSTAFICKFAKPCDVDQLVRNWLKNPERYLAAGHRCYRDKQTANSSATNDVAFCFLDDRTVVGASQDWLPAILGATNAKSPLLDELKKTDTSADLTEIFVNTDAAKEMLIGNISAERSAPFKPFAELPNVLSAAKLTLHASPEIALRLTLTGNDEASAAKIVEIAKSWQQLARPLVPVLQAQHRPSMTKQQRGSLDYAIALATKLAEGLVPQQSGTEVTIDYKDLGSTDSFMRNVVLPELIRMQAFDVELQDLNSLQRISLAMLRNVHAENTFPANAIYSKDGKPLLSWRVAMLPHLGQKKLYDEFHLDEPWDSDHNKPLIAKMPYVYQSRGITPVRDGRTGFVVPVGKGTIFDGQKGIAPSDISDGLPNTILIISVGPDKAVVWTKPEELQFDPKHPLAGLGTIDGDSIEVSFADRSSRMLRKDIDPDTFRRLILRADGHRIDRSKL